MSFTRRDADPGYRLIDFGDGRKLESWGGWTTDRPSPAAEGHRCRMKSWSADARFDVDRRRWTGDVDGDRWLKTDDFSMRVEATPFGHVGVFPEQADNWRWLREGVLPGEAALNLFAYTGGSTLAMVAGGAAVTHVDAAKPNVDVARGSVTANGWVDRPVRWIVDDALKYARREVRRGRKYRTIVADPPAYGHGPTGAAWRIERDAPDLIAVLIELFESSRPRLLFTGHSPGWSVESTVAAVRRHGEFDFDTGRMQLPCDDARTLDAGWFVRATGR